jgi:hypothetical protein
MERIDFINANHMMMCRFSGPEDDGYIRIKGAISRLMSGIQARKDKESEWPAFERRNFFGSKQI